MGGSCELREFRPDKASFGLMMGGEVGGGRTGLHPKTVGWVFVGLV